MTSEPPAHHPSPAEAIWRADENAGASAPPPAPPAMGPRRTARDRRPRGDSRGRRKKIVWAIGILLLVLAADGIYVAVQLGTNLRSASQALEEAQDHLEDGDVSTADGLLRTALDDAQSALSLRRHPAYLVASVLDEVDAVTALALAAEDVSEAGIAAGDAARRLGVTPEREIASTVYAGGRVRFDALDAVQPLIAGADDELNDARRHLDEAPEPGLGIVEDALADATSAVDRAHDAVRKGRVLFAALPELLGRDEPKTYLLAFQALGEARATGGIVGFYGVLDAAEGNLTLRHAGSIHELRRTAQSPPVDAPAWFARNYAPQFALRQALQANVSPRVPVVAQVLLEMYEASRGEALDGVLFMDPITLQALLRSTGPITVPGVEGSVGPRNAADVLLRQSYLDFGESRQQNVYLGLLIQEFWRRVQEGELEGAELAKAVAEQVATNHLMVYSTDPASQSALADLEADGDYTRGGPNVQAVFNNNYAVNKVDYFLRRSVETRVDLTVEGDARVRTTITMHNDAPAGPPSLLLGPSPNKPEDPPGLNRMVLAVLLPQGAQPHQFFPNPDSDPQEPFVYSDSGRPVVWDVLEMKPGTSREVAFTYVVPDVIEVGPDGGSASFVLWPQPRVQPDDYRLTISPPDGFHVREEVDGSAFTTLLELGGTLDREQETRFRMERV